MSELQRKRARADSKQRKHNIYHFRWLGEREGTFREMRVGKNAWDRARFLRRMA